MRIAVIGWYGHDNEGDERLLHSLRLALAGQEVVVFGGWSEGIASIDYINTCDYVLIGGGGLILRGANWLVNFIDQIEPPLAFVGVSIEAQHADMEDFFAIILEKATAIMVRDRSSARILRDHSKVTVAPDLTFFDPLPVHSAQGNAVALNLRPWFFWRAELHGKLHDTLLGIDRRWPAFERMYPFKKWSPKKAAAIIDKQFTHVHPMPFYFEAGVNNDEKLLREIFDNVPTRFDYSVFERIAYVISMRFHGVVFAVQTGTPALSLSYQPKNDSFLRDIGAPELSVDIYDRDALPAGIEHLKTHHKAIRELFLEQRQRLTLEAKGAMNAFLEITIGKSKA